MLMDSLAFSHLTVFFFFNILFSSLKILCYFVLLLPRNCADEMCHILVIAVQKLRILPSLGTAAPVVTAPERARLQSVKNLLKI